MVGPSGILAGLAAAALHGSDWIDDDVPMELVWRNPHPPAGIITRNHLIRGDEVTCVARIPATTPARTAYDLGRLPPRNRAVARLDALMRANPFPIEDVRLLTKAHGVPAVCDNYGPRCRLSTAGQRLQRDVAAPVVDRFGASRPGHPDTRP